MTIMTTGMHPSRILGFPGRVSLFGNGIGVYIRAQPYGVGACSFFQRANQAGASYATGDGDAHFFQTICQKRAGIVFVKCRFRMTVQFMAPICELMS